MRARRSPHDIGSFGVTEVGAATLERLFADSEQSREELLERAGLSAEQLLAVHEILRALLDAFDEGADDG